MSKAPIGIFDSGVGGTSILKEVHQLLPNENIIFLADSVNAPYGEKSKKEIIQLSDKNTKYLIQQQCKLIIVACNTATTNAIDFLRASYQIPFIGIEPAIKPAALQTQSKVVGVLATRGTITSELFSKTSSLFASNIKVIEQVGDGLVPLIEQNKIYTPEMSELLLKYITPMILANIDYLVLGCTHYPYLVPLLKELLPDHVKIIDSGEAVAKQTKKILQQENLLNSERVIHPEMQFYTNLNKALLQQFVSDIITPFKVSFLNF
ncbi:glutamate racemase [Zhouia sp. PK063]|uniref:glutamate racemase n=1 Tax=Zhouia sp. PK063 TaxID=3373602 RepID=UPI003798DAC7